MLAKPRIMITIQRMLAKVNQRIPGILAVLLCCLFLLSYYSRDHRLTEQLKEISNNSFLLALKDQSGVPRWTYECSKDACVRREAGDGEPIKPMDVCWLTCGTYGPLWPYPKRQKRSSGETVKFIPSNLRLVKVASESEPVKKLINQAFNLKTQEFTNYSGIKKSKGGFRLFWPFTTESDPALDSIVEVYISATSDETTFKLTTDESYEINIQDEPSSKSSGVKLSVRIWAKTFFGVRHGIETLSQLIVFDKSCGCLQILKNYYAIDSPKYPYRGILLDSARNFIPINIIKRVIDGMAMNKLNILHWHLTDSNSFTFHSKRVPQMTQYGALSEDEIYFPEQILDLVKYAKVRGVKIIPELDAPSHAGNGWQFGKKLGLGELAFYVNVYDKSWNKICYQPPCGLLNPVNINTYNILEQIYADMLEVFDNDIFHMGGDEVNMNSWTMQPELGKWLNSSQTIKLWEFFQAEAFQRLRLRSDNVKAILWTSKLTEMNLLTKNPLLDPKDYILQVWDGARSGRLQGYLRKGYSVILSFVDKFYLDWGVGTWLGNEHLWPYHIWQTIYDADLNVDETTQLIHNETQKLPRKSNLILGAEAPLWGEKVGPSELEVKLWPRAAALAEKLWSYPKSRNDEVYTRINYHNYRMKQKGIPTSQLQPESCLHFNGHCHNSKDTI